MLDAISDKTAEASRASSDATPMMAQYLEIKAQQPGSLLFYRMGDFYEMFFGDAEIASKDLGIALTKRGKHLGQDIAMCGVPVHAVDHYLQKLIRLGHKVALCEQMEDPAEAKKRGSKSVVKRGVVRLITPGTITEDTLLEQANGNHLVALSWLKGSDAMAIAWCDISTGNLAVMTTDRTRLATDLARVQPSELLLADQCLDDATLSQVARESGAALSPLPSSRFDSASAEQRVAQHFGVASLSGFGNFERAEVSALGALIDYITLTQVNAVPYLRPPRQERAELGLMIDAATRANLELTRTLQGERQGSLLAVIDRSVTPAGKRLLASWLAQPLADAALINQRLDSVAWFLENETFLVSLRQQLHQLPDLERALARITANRGGPRDLATLQRGLLVARDLLQAFKARPEVPAFLQRALTSIAQAPFQLAVELTNALGDELPHLTRDGGFIAKDYHPELDDMRSLRDDTRQVIAALQARYAERTGIRSLKIKHNNVLGYFIEIAQAQAELISSDAIGEDLRHRQSVANAMRYSTATLQELETKIAGASDRALAIELSLFSGFVEQIFQARDVISNCAEGLATLDVVAALAALANEQRYCRPRVDHSLELVITQGRHPVVEAALHKDGLRRFTANDCALHGDDKRVWLLTGPNMAGKSTFLRQNAIVVVLAQIGSFVPADSAHIGVVDRLFSRVGAADDLARGRSTFMVEMVETAAILNQATERSFVILDEIGRGTATFDGLSIAWATLEYLHEANRARALFATHYHELNGLTKTLSGLVSMTMAVKEWKGDIVFLHDVIAGAADRSYGIQAARLAGLPSTVIARAFTVLAHLEQQRDEQSSRHVADDLPLFSVAAKPAAQQQKSVVQERLKLLDPDQLSPREALAYLYELKNLARDEGEK